MVGSAFAEATKARGWETLGVARFSASSRQAINEESCIIRSDITDCVALGEIFKRLRPEIVIHMAAQAFNGLSWQMENLTHEVNINGTKNVLQCCKKYAPEAKVLLACSSAQYGDVNSEDCPLKEDRALKPITPYGVSKVATECLGYQFYKNYNLQVYLPRMFIHVGPGHPPATAIQNFARQLALIDKKKTKSVMRVGNLNSARDFIDVRDGVDAMMKLIEFGKPGWPVNIGTGKAFTIQETLETLISISGKRVEIKTDPALLRPNDEPLLLADISRVKSLGWAQRYTFETTLEDVYKNWLARLKNYGN